MAMLRPGFLGQLASWVADFNDRHPQDLERAMADFETESLLKRGADVEQLAGLFSEWLVFDHKSAAFGGTTGIMYFCSHNPLGVSEHEILAYRELLDFKVGYFEVATVRPAISVTLRDMEGSAYDVADVNSSMNLTAGETIWTRIAQVGGMYQMVGSEVLRAPITYSPGMKKIMRAWGKNAVDAKHAAHMSTSTSSPGDALAEAGEYEPEEEAARKFDEAVKAAGMGEMISSATIKKWTYNERKFPIGFPMKTMYFLLPEDLATKQRDDILSTLQTYLINLPRRSLKGKTPLQASVEQDPAERQLEVDGYSYGDYGPDLRDGFDLMRKDPKKAYGAFEKLVARLLEEKVPLITTFRIYINAALCRLMDAEHATDALGFELIRAALRLNPLYDFGLKQKERFIDPIEDFSSAPKKDRPLLKDIYATIVQDGTRRYRHSAFRRYEDFLRDAGISLKYKTVTTPTTFRSSDGKLVKIGRNEPCPCNSGKKYKKCCDK